MLITNKKAYHNYTISDTFEAGIVLSGDEVKSLKTGHINLDGAYVVFKPSKNFFEPWLINANIPRYRFSSSRSYNPDRLRKLLLNKKQVSSLIGEIQSKKSVLLPLKVYTKNRLIKIEIGLGRIKKKKDKRELIKKRDVEKEIKVQMKYGRG